MSSKTLRHADEQGAPRAAAAIPPTMDGYRVECVTWNLGSMSVDLLGVADLESHVDREDLLTNPDVEPPYWALVWTGAQVLAQHLAAVVECGGKLVLDAGCGLGITAIAAALRGGRVVALDRAREPLRFLRESAVLNRVGVHAVRGDVRSLPVGVGFDVILAAELLYDPASYDVVASSLSRALAREGVLWIADARRVTTTAFYERLESCGLMRRQELEFARREEGALVRVRLSEFGR